MVDRPIFNLSLKEIMMDICYPEIQNNGCSICPECLGVIKTRNKNHHDSTKRHKQFVELNKRLKALLGIKY